MFASFTACKTSTAHPSFLQIRFLNTLLTSWPQSLSIFLVFLHKEVCIECIVMWNQSTSKRLRTTLLFTGDVRHDVCLAIPPERLAARSRALALLFQVNSNCEHISQKDADTRTFVLQWEVDYKGRFQNRSIKVCQRLTRWRKQHLTRTCFDSCMFSLRKCDTVSDMTWTTTQKAAPCTETVHRSHLAVHLNAKGRSMHRNRAWVPSSFI